MWLWRQQSWSVYADDNDDDDDDYDGDSDDGDAGDDDDDNDDDYDDADGVAGWDCHHHRHCCGFLVDIQHQTDFPASEQMIMFACLFVCLFVC